MAETAPVLEVEGLCKTYDQLEAVKGLSFSLSRGEIFGLIGANGAGKTTTIAMILGLVTPSSGTIRIFGQDPERSRGQVLSRMNFSSPYVDLPARLTVTQNLLVYAQLYGVKNARQRVAEILEQLEVTDQNRQRFGQLSSGQRTRVALAKSLINDPELLLLDEPTVSLDPDIAERVRTWLDEYRKRTGATLLITSHNMTEVERICDRVLILKGGERFAEGTPSALLERFGRDTLEQVFLDIARSEEEAAS